MHRLNQYKWSVEKAIETPYKPKGPYNIKKKKSEDLQSIAK
jgi:hypothetical protein